MSLHSLFQIMNRTVTILFRYPSLQLGPGLFPHLTNDSDKYMVSNRTLPLNVLAYLGALLLLFLCACSSLSSTSSMQKEAELVEDGYIAMSGGDYATAEHLLRQALVINDKNPYALLNLGVICQETQRYEQARQYYQAVIDLNPKEAANASNIDGYTGKNLSEIATINVKNLPPPVNSQEPVDTDNDGVPDNLDRCNNTPEKASVNDDGCWILFDLFPSGKSGINPSVYPLLDEVLMILENNPTLKLEIQGHTDNKGKAEFNQRLSEKRAQSVMKYLIQQGIAPERLRWSGHGSSRPLASNQTEAGRTKNRRVELNPIE